MGKTPRSPRRRYGGSRGGLGAAWGRGFLTTGLFPTNAPAASRGPRALVPRLSLPWEPHSHQSGMGVLCPGAGWRLPGQARWPQLSPAWLCPVPTTCLVTSEQ